jgi:hypothetical protein
MAGVSAAARQNRRQKLSMGIEMDYCINGGSFTPRRGLHSAAVEVI